MQAKAPTSMMDPNDQKDCRMTSVTALQPMGANSMYNARGTCDPPSPMPTKNLNSSNHCNAAVTVGRFPFLGVSTHYLLVQAKLRKYTATENNAMKSEKQKCA